MAFSGWGCLIGCLLPRQLIDMLVHLLTRVICTIFFSLSLKGACLFLPPNPNLPLSPRNGPQEQKHKGRPSSLLGGVPKGGPGGALRARCVCLSEGGGVLFKREEKNWRFSQSSRGTHESWKVLELKMAKCCGDGGRQKCLVCTAKV